MQSYALYRVPVLVSYLFSSGTTDISFMDPVVVGRHVFSVTNDTVSGVVGDIRDALCAVVDIVLDITKGTSAIFKPFYYLWGIIYIK